VQAAHALAVGAKALQILTTKSRLTPWLGAPLQGKNEFEKLTVIPIYHPSFCLRPRGNAYIPLVTMWVARAWGLATGELKPWRWPTLVTESPYAPALTKILRARVVSVDIENIPSSGRIRCIGFGTNKLGVSVPLPPEGSATHEELVLVRQILAAPSRKVYHNAAHDIVELRANGYELGGDFDDTLLMHATVAPQVLHNLALCCAAEFHAPAWKAEFKIEGDDKASVTTRFEKAPLEELLPYNAKDNVMQAKLHARLDTRLRATHKGRALYSMYKECARVGMHMTEHGVLVDNTKRLEYRHRLMRRRARAIRELRIVARAAGKVNWETFKVASQKELHDLFFTCLHVRPTKWSETTGAAKLDEKALQPLTTAPEPLVAAAARSLLRARRWHKFLKTYIDNLPIGKDERCHPKWKVHGAKTGRWACDEPNLMNIPKPKVKVFKNGAKKVIAPGLRDLFCAAPGRWLLEADYSQLELRIVALLAGDKQLLAWYAQNLDVHTLNARALFNVAEPTKQQRDLAKRFVYAANYGAEAVKIWQSLVVDFPNLSLSIVEMCKMRWFKAHSEIRLWHQKQLKFARENLFIECPIDGRREYFHGGQIEPNKVLNFPVQSSGAAIINPAVPKIYKRFQELGHSAIIMQVHDALVVETSNPLVAGAVMKEYLEAEVEIEGARCKFPVDLKIGRNWGDTVELKETKEYAWEQALEQALKGETK
jgi:DNA polymerase I